MNITQGKTKGIQFFYFLTWLNIWLLQTVLVLLVQSQVRNLYLKIVVIYQLICVFECECMSVCA